MRLWAPLLLCLLLGCTLVDDPSVLEANIVRPGNFVAGSGVIQSVGVIRGAREPGTGADQGERPDLNLYRLYLHMDNGSFQTVDIDNGRFFPGEAVELTNDGRVVLVSGTSLNKALNTGR